MTEGCGFRSNKTECLLTFFNTYAKGLFILIIVEVILRLYEYSSMTLFSFFDENVLEYEARGLYHTLLYKLALQTVLVFPLFALFYFFLRNYLRRVFYSLVASYMILHVMLVEYLRNASVLLNEVIFSYSFDVLMMIVTSSSTTNIPFFLFSLLFVLTLTWYVAQHIRRLKLPKYFGVCVMIVPITLFFIKDSLRVKPEKFLIEDEYFIAEDKTLFFMDGVYDYLTSNEDLALSRDELIHQSILYQNNFSNKQFVDPEYPLLHRADTNDVLGDFFHLSDTLPNLVFLIIEGLGKDIQGEGALHGGFTQFIDSLASESLYWPNALSTSQRTFGVLPGLLGSLPYGKRGFALQDRYPSHFTLLSLLQKSGYKSGFYYGSWTNFDSMGSFLKYSSDIHEIPHFNGYEQMGKNKNGSTWGYGDLSLFKRSIEYVDSLALSAPRLDVFLTLNMHAPWRADNEELYLNMVDSIKYTDEVSIEQLAQIDKHKNVFATILSTDFALREYFRQAQEKRWYNNTIFIISGDHRVIPLSKRNALSHYNVPIIMYSPMLKQPRKMRAVTSHLDVVPSLVSMLQSKFKIDVPKHVHWQGDVIDTTQEFVSTQFIPIMRDSRNISILLSDSVVYDRGKMYLVGEDLDLQEVEDELLRESLSKKIENFNFINSYVCNKSRLLPKLEYVHFLRE